MKDREKENKAPASKKNVWLRAAVAVVLIAVAAAAFTYGFTRLFSAETGYRTVESTSGKADCSSDFVFTYHLGVSGKSPTAEWKAVTSLYSEKAVYYYRLFHAAETFEDTPNLALINQSPNTAVTVPDELYRALEKAAADPGRNVYLAPVYAYYEVLFSSSYDEDAALWDPAENEALGETCRRALTFIGDEEQISLKFLGNDTVSLTVSPAYLRFAEEVGIDAFLDFGWLKNAYIADLMAEDFIRAGFLCGVLSARDGFVRNFDESAGEYAFDFFYENGGAVRIGGKLTYSDECAIVTFHAFALDEAEERLVYTYADGRRVTRYLTLADGLPHDARGAVTAYARNGSCADLALSLLPYYTGDRAETFTDPGAGLIRYDGRGVRHREIEGFTFSPNA